MTILDRPPVQPFTDPRLARLPGLAPLEPHDWLVDWPDTAEQLAERARLIAERRGEVLDCLDEARPAAAELLETVLTHLSRRPPWQVAPDGVTLPGGARVALDRGDPLATLGRIVSEDFCLMSPGDGEYRLTGAILCFPGHWRLAEKIGRPMTAIHDPVPQYDAETAVRVNRFFQRLQAGNLLYRVNWSVAETPEMFTPGGHPKRDELRYLRTERQTFLRLADTGVIAFGIRTSMAPLTSLTPDQARGFAKAISGLSPEALEGKGGRIRLTELRDRLLKQAG